MIFKIREIKNLNKYLFTFIQLNFSLSHPLVTNFHVGKLEAN